MVILDAILLLLRMLETQSPDDVFGNLSPELRDGVILFLKECVPEQRIFNLSPPTPAQVELARTWFRTQ